jgi:hypothetical protein
MEAGGAATQPPGGALSVARSLRVLWRIVLRRGAPETEVSRGCCGVAVLRREREGRRRSSARCPIVGGAAFAPREDDQLILVARKYPA